MKKIKVLFVAANPLDSDRLKLDEEIRAISSKIRASEHRDLLQLQAVWAVRPDDLLQALNEHRPDIVHFSGHGTASGEIVLLDDNGAAKPVSATAMTALFRTLKDNIHVVVLNACYSRSQAEAITDVIDCSIGMNTAIGDEAAIVFAASFYRALGFGRSLQDAFDQGRTALLLEGIPEADTPELLMNAGLDSSQLFILREDDAPEYQPPIVGRLWLTGSTLSMSGVSNTNPARSFSVRAHPLDEPPIKLQFDVTNPNKLDLKIDRFFIDVIDFANVEINKVWIWLGAGMPIRKFECTIMPEIGRYECVKISEGFEYIRLSNGEMESFGIEIRTGTEGLYRLRLSMEYSIGEVSQQIELDDKVEEIGFFHKDKHSIER